MTEEEEARLNALVERIRRNPRLDPVYWEKELRKDMAKTRPAQREAFLDNVERWVARQEEILLKKKAARGRSNERGGVEAGDCAARGIQAIGTR